jgi:hypothetical protein
VARVGTPSLNITSKKGDNRRKKLNIHVCVVPGCPGEKPKGFSNGVEIALYDGVGQPAIDRPKIGGAWAPDPAGSACSGAGK